MLTPKEIEEAFSSSQSYISLLKEADRVNRDRHGTEVSLERAIFLSWYCSLASCSFCYMSAHGKKASREKARRAPWRVLAEAELCRRLGWNIEFLSAGYGALEEEELRDIVGMVVGVNKKPLWLNVGVQENLDSWGGEVEGVVGSVETLDHKLREKVVPHKPLKPIESMLEEGKEAGLKTGITVVLGLGESRESLGTLFSFIEEKELDRVIFYSLNPHQGTPYQEATPPASLYHSRVIALTRLNFPGLKIISGNWANQVASIGVNLLAGANGLTKFPLFSMFGTSLGRRVEEEVREAGRELSGTFSDWEALVGRKPFPREACVRDPNLSERAREKLDYFRPRINEAIQEYISKAEEKSKRVSHG